MADVIAIHENSEKEACGSTFSNFDKLNSRDFSFPRTNSQRGRALDSSLPLSLCLPPVLIVELGDTFRDYLREDRLSCDMSLGARRGL